MKQTQFMQSNGVGGVEYLLGQLYKGIFGEKSFTESVVTAFELGMVGLDSPGWVFIGSLFPSILFDPFLGFFAGL